MVNKFKEEREKEIPCSLIGRGFVVKDYSKGYLHSGISR